MLHSKCLNRIHYKKVCPVHGEVPNDEIVSGYEAAKGEHVVVKKEEIARLKEDGDKGISIDAFIDSDAIDPVYYSGRTYYLVPAGKPGQHPYAILHKVMANEERHAIARVILSGREQVAVIRPLGKLLAMTLLTYAEQLKKPSAFEDEVDAVKVSDQELALAENLVQASTAADLDFSSYHDMYAEKLTKLLEKKSGTRRAAVHRAHQPAVINLMDALRQSLDRAQKSRKHPAASHKRGAPRRRKTG